MKRLVKPLLLGLVSAIVSGCLVANSKIVRIELAEDGSGTGSIYFVGLSSLQEGEDDRSLTDYDELLASWINGDSFERANPALVNVRKRLFEEKDLLIGEAHFQFYNPIDVGLYRHNDSGPWMLYPRTAKSDIEFFETTNGTYGGSSMPVVFWPEETNEFVVQTRYQFDDQPSSSLLPIFKQLLGE